MGVLDDAIREHIELKRQHGAREPELERQEQEALGPARREAPAPAEAAGAGADEASAGPPAQPAADPAGEDFDVAGAETAPPAAEPESDLAPFVEPGGLSDPDPFAEPDPEPAPWSAEPSHASGSDDAEDEDVLEETPEFLQETPEHDRLWFEQKPPRDFDFDE